MGVVASWASRCLVSEPPLGLHLRKMVSWKVRVTGESWWGRGVLTEEESSGATRRRHPTDQPLTPHSPARPPHARTRSCAFLLHRHCSCPGGGASLPGGREAAGVRRERGAKHRPGGQPVPACAREALKTTASIDPRRAAPPSGHTGAATPPLEAVEAARTTPPPRQAAHDTPPPSLVTREATRETHLPVGGSGGGGGGGGGGERGWTRWWEGGGHNAKLEAKSEIAKMEAARRSDEEAGEEERPPSIGEVKPRPRPLLHSGDDSYPRSTSFPDTPDSRQTLSLLGHVSARPHFLPAMSLPNHVIIRPCISLDHVPVRPYSYRTMSSQTTFPSSLLFVKPCPHQTIDFVPREAVA
ncbi:hypothetical protein E2C01_056130 [Portunus trituberculatus]|uniref:Uncharacterized protein n=1 Tax=Portunus trituberculatus TaxID=210409 RepID=A0A5B7GPK4_PORTR|nr:hypothetical protein [Portunus trituberculatus]